MVQNLSGLQNLGNTCYINSILQLIMQCTDFIDLFQNHCLDSDIFKNVSSFIQNYKTNKITSPEDILSIITDKNLFIKGYQYDAHEFLIQFLDIIHEEMKKCLNNTSIINVFEYKFYTIFKNINRIDDIKILENKETILTLPFSKSLNDSFTMFENKEFINNWESEKYKEYTKAEKHSTIYHWPKYLFIQINRYDSKFQKINDEMEIPLQYNDYQLRGAVIHHGFHNFGHYVCIMKLNDKYYLCDDERISEMNENFAIQMIKKAYLLLFIHK